MLANNIYCFNCFRYVHMSLVYDMPLLYVKYNFLVLDTIISLVFYFGQCYLKYIEKKNFFVFGSCLYLFNVGRSLIDFIIPVQNVSFSLLFIILKRMLFISSTCA